MRSKFETQTVRVHEARAAVSWLDHRDPFSNTMQQHLRCAPNVGRPLPGPASARRRCALRNPQGNAAEPAFASMESGTIQVMCPRGVRARRSTAARPRCRPPCRCTGCPRAGARGESPSPAPRTRGRRLLDDLAGREVEDDRRRALGVPDGGEDVEGGGEATGAASIQILSNLVSEHFPSRVNVSLGDERIECRCIVSKVDHERARDQRRGNPTPPQGVDCWCASRAQLFKNGDRVLDPIAGPSVKGTSAGRTEVVAAVASKVDLRHFIPVTRMSPGTPQGAPTTQVKPDARRTRSFGALTLRHARGRPTSQSTERTRHRTEARQLQARTSAPRQHPPAVVATRETTLPRSRSPQPLRGDPRSYRSSARYGEGRNRC